MQNLILTFASQNTFSVSSEESGELLGQISYSIGEDGQPNGFIFTSIDGKYGQRRTTLSESIKELLHDEIHIRIAPIE